MTRARGWALALTVSFAFYALLGLCLWLAVTHPGAARVVAFFLGSAVYSFLLVVWAYARGNRAGLAWNEVEVIHLRGQRDQLRREVHDALGQVDDAMAEVAASWRREEMRRG